MAGTVVGRKDGKMASGHRSPKLVSSQELLVRAHQDRIRIVQCLKDSSQGEMTTAQMAREIKVSLGNLNHHVKKLAAGGILEATRQEQVRGSLATYYRLSPAFLQRVPDGVALDALAAYLRECNSSADVDRVRELVRETGRCVVEGEVPAPKPSRGVAKFPEDVPSTKQELAEKLERMQVIPLERRCQCEGTIADSEGCCVSCSKPKLIPEAVSA